MIRKNFYLPEQQVTKLKNLAIVSGISMSEILRRAIDEYFLDDNGVFDEDVDEGGGDGET
jgi:hypothetical protein